MSRNTDKRSIKNDKNQDSRGSVRSKLSQRKLAYDASGNLESSGNGSDPYTTPTKKSEERKNPEGQKKTDSRKRSKSKSQNDADMVFDHGKIGSDCRGSRNHMGLIKSQNEISNQLQRQEY